MSFTSLEFIILFAVSLLAVLFLQKLQNKIYKHVFLLIASYVFYGWWDWRFCFLLLFVTVAAYVTALFVKNKAAFVTGTVVPLVVLAFFKYFNFFLDSFSNLIGRELGTLAIILPVGISFYTFQALSYVIDVKRGKLEAEKNFINLALYISFFPQLVAGPIVKANEFLPQLKEDRRITLPHLEYGLQLMLFGLFKKIVIADHLSVFVDDVFASPTEYSWITIVLGVISYSIQIYFDFSGYSDIAIGCAKCFGYDFCPNFNMPYVSENISVFWKRWHISLSSWLMEYLYFPLGGNRKGKARRYINLMLTMLLGGLWHGASWTFVVWGAIHGLALCIDKVIPRKKNPGVVTRAVSMLATFIFVSFVWIFFRADTFTKAWQVIKGIFTLQGGIVQPYLWTFIAVFVLLLGTAIAIIRSKKKGLEKIEGFYPTVKLNTVFGLTLFFLAAGLILGLAFTGASPFVYFQF